MPVAAGTRLGPYEVVELLGKGGMGEVYRARDPRLGRDVALKVLHDVASDPARLKRFELEARAVAALNHPHILTVHDVGSHDGAPYVVSELLEGESLREVLSRRLPTQRQILTWAVQAAQGLAAAHQKGIVHRDLKPENLFLTSDGRIKILDFGLAKQSAPSLDSSELTESSPTKPGVVMGTVAYMSPEQAQAQPVDARSDLFSFGVVLYELLARKHPFRRDTVAATVGSILQETPPPLVSLDPTIPRAVDGIVRRCLEKRKEDRFQGAHDLGLALEAVLEAPTGSAVLEEVEEKSPYPGLASFTEKDAPVFFGREGEVAALWEKIRHKRLLAVIGPSGAGKTSFLRAGVMASRPEGWGAVHATPGANPALGLAHALTPELAGDPEAMRDLIDGVTELAQTGEADRVVSAVRRWRARHAEVLLVVDQLEELFTLSPRATQEGFAALLGRLADDADVHVVLSLRDDFLLRCFEQPPLAPSVTPLTVMLPLKRDALRRALVEPALKRGYRFEDGALVEEMVEAVEGARGALPLLAFALGRLWEKRNREKKLLTREAYREIAGVEGALAQHAEATMERIGSERQGLVREIFRNLVTAQGTRAVIDREELLSAFPERTAAEEVLNHLVDARLLTTYELEGKEGEPSHHRIEVVHESLLKAWPRLVRWQAQDEEGAVLRDQLKQAAHLWDEKGRKADLLWTGMAYREYELWRERYAGALTAPEEDFARSMRERARRRRRLVRIVATSAFLAVSAVAAAIALSRQQAVDARHRAEAEARRAEAGKLLTLGHARSASDPTAALAFTIAALERADTTEARQQALRVLWRSPVARVLPRPGTGFFSLDFSPDGRRLVATGFESRPILFPDDGGPAVEFRFREGESSPLLRVVALPGEVVLAWSEAQFWAESRSTAPVLAWALDGRPLPSLDGSNEKVLVTRKHEVFTIGPRPAPGPGRELRQWAFDGGRPHVVRTIPLGAGDPDPTLRFLVRVAGEALFVRPFAPSGATGSDRLLGRHDRSIRYTAASADGSRLASEDGTGDVRVWSTSSGALFARTQADPPHAYSVPRFDAGGTRLAWGSATQAATLVWDLRDPADTGPVLLGQGQDPNERTGVAFHPGGRWLAAGTSEGIAFWPLDWPRPRVLRGHVAGPVMSLGFTPDSRRLVSCARDGARVWPLAPGLAGQWRVDAQREYFCYGATPVGNTAVAVAVPGLGLYLAPTGGGPARRAVPVRRGCVLQAVAADPGARWVATAPQYVEGPADLRLFLLDTASGRAQVLPLRDRDPGNAATGVYALHFTHDGSLLVSGHGGIERWNLAGSVTTTLYEEPGRSALVAGTSADARRVVALVSEGQLRDSVPRNAEVVLIDLAAGRHWKATGYGSDPIVAALDATGERLATGDREGVIRIGRSDGGPVHVLPGEDAAVIGLAISPDGKWIASSSGTEIRLWPMPDVSKPPFHTLPHEELMGRLRALTNVRVVEDRSRPTGYRLVTGPFPGWKDVPTW